MKVFNLRCPHDHRFEGWFASDDDWASQRERKLIECPLCGDSAVERVPSAPRLNLLSSSRDDAREVVSAPADTQAQWLRALRDIVERTEDVGERFADEARRIHYGEAQQRAIRGRATREQSDELREEGIQVMALSLPPALKDPLQ
jgi:hypothetical protein